MGGGAKAPPGLSGAFLDTGYPSDPEGNTMANRFPRCERIDWHSVNAMGLSKFCLAHGRYEVASELHELGTEWYERFAKPEGGATASDRAVYRDVLKSYKDFFPEFALLIETKDRLLRISRTIPRESSETS